MSLARGSALPQEEAHADPVEHAPTEVLEEIKFELVDITHADRGDRMVVGPEEPQLQNAAEVDQVRGRTHEERFGSAQTELIQVNQHEHQENDTCFLSERRKCGYHKIQ